MTEEIKVHVVDYGPDRNLMMRYRDPYTHRHVAKTTGTRNQKEAVKAAAKWEDDLHNGRYQKPSRLTWEAFRDYYSANALTALASSSVTTYDATLNVFERTCNPQKLSDVSAGQVMRFAKELRDKGLSEATVGRHLRQLKVILRWAQRQGLLHTLPQFEMPKRSKGALMMKGRAPTLEEFERMLAAVPKVVENTAASSWRFYLRVLWDSGLRLSESLVLRWDDAPGAIVVDFSHKRPMLRIPGEAQKARRDQLWPMTPEFAKLLESVPESQRHGRVFKLLGIDGRLLPASRMVVGKMVTAIGKSAGVVVNDKGKNASAHDLRRAFGQRWALKVMPAVLRELMRHTDINTTMKYYVGQNAEATADVVWAAVGNTAGNTRQPEKTADAKTTRK